MSVPLTIPSPTVDGSEEQDMPSVLSSSRKDVLLDTLGSCCRR